MALNPNPRRALTNREIACVLSSMAGAFAMDTPPEVVMSAFEHFVEHKKAYLKVWEMLAKGLPLSDGINERINREDDPL